MSQPHVRALSARIRFYTDISFRIMLTMQTDLTEFILLAAALFVYLGILAMANRKRAPEE